jgi:hypothetical protein
MGSMESRDPSAERTAPYASSLRRIGDIRSKLDAARAEEAQLRAERDELLVALVGQGVRYAVLADASGLTSGRVAQLVSRSRQDLLS